MANKQQADEPLREIALFAGGGGGILGTELCGATPICAVELNPYAASILAARQNDGILPPFPIWDDVSTFDGKAWRGSCELVSGGFPCQDLSNAKTHTSGGKFVERGLAGKRSGLWGEMARIIGEVLPKFVFVENVTALVAGGLDRVLSDIAEMGYNARWGCFRASSLGAPHARERFFLLAYSQRERWDEATFFPFSELGRPLPQASKREFSRTGFISGAGAWEDGRNIESSLLGVDDRLPSGLDRLAIAGNAQVPIVAASAFTILRPMPE